jgi:hypothetical protein
MADPGTCAVSRPLLTNLVGKDNPFQLTTAPGTKSLPVTVNMN